MKILIAILWSGALLLAQTPSRDSPARALSGTGVIAGTLMSDDAQPRPIRLATMTLSGPSLREVTATDENGRFAFQHLPAGRFTLSADKPGFVASDYGAKRPGGSGIPVVLDAGGNATIAMTLPRGGVIAGTISGPDGTPASNVQVRVFEYQEQQNGERQLSPARSLGGWRWSRTTDDRGAFRFYGLAPGEYYLSATGNVTGRLVTTQELDWAQRLLRASPGTQAEASPAAGQSASFAPVFFPGTPDPRAASGIALRAGEQRTDVDFALQFVPTATVSGVVVDPDGQPPQAVQVNMLSPSLSVFIGQPVFIRPSPDGRFSASGVLPGQYVLAARGSAHDSPPVSTTGPGGNTLSLPLWALMDVTVDGRDIRDLQVRLLPGVNVSGRLSFDSATGSAPPDVTKVRVSLQSAGQSVSVGASDTTANADGSFTLTGVAPGRYRLTASVPAPANSTPAWTLKSSVVEGIDSLDHPFDVRSGEPVSNAVVTLTDRGSEISGTLIGADGKPAPELFVVVFTTDRAFWVPQSRRIRSARPGNTGSFRIAGLPPGEYYVSALTDLETNRLYSPAYLEPLIVASLKISLAEGEKKVQDLRLASGK